MSTRRQKVAFIAKGKVSKPVKVSFYNKDGEKIAFKAHKQVTKPVRVEFYHLIQTSTLPTLFILLLRYVARL